MHRAPSIIITHKTKAVFRYPFFLAPVAHYAIAPFLRMAPSAAIVAPFLRVSVDQRYASWPIVNVDRRCRALIK
jgi:hypothetical protein